MKTEQQMKQVITKKNREQFYNYFMHLGYDHKTAACLALFTYGKCRFTEFSMDNLYEALSKDNDYLPPEEMNEEVLMPSKGSRRAVTCGSPIRHSSVPCSAPPNASPRQSVVSAPVEGQSRGVFHQINASMNSRAAGQMPEPEACLSETARYSEPASRPTGIKPFFPNLAGALGFATDEYERIEEKDAHSTAAEPTSTFRMTTNTASAGIILNQLRNSRRIDRSMVRIEEMLNYFRYESKIPRDAMFHPSYEIMDADENRKYLYINVQGREEIKAHQNIVILLDVSGSMYGNTEQTQAIIATIISKLGNGDKLSLITYSDDDIVEMEAYTINRAKDRIHALEKLLSVEITGCTNGSKGIEQAYRIGKKNYIPDGNNQVILITDGDLNFGITDKGGLEKLIEKKKKDHLFLSVIGTGLYNYKDDKLEVLSKHGNGVYRTVNSLTDVRKSIDEEYASLVNIIAKDVKAQVEFNTEVVEKYRLLGFENRTLSREDFTNDKIISEPFGSGGYGIALYELQMKTGTAPANSGLKYSKLVTTGSSELGTIKIRYKEPLEDKSHELEKVIETAEASFTDNLRLAFVVYVCAEKLRNSEKISDEEMKLARKLYAKLGSDIREKNAVDLYKLALILEKSKRALGIGILEERFSW